MKPINIVSYNDLVRDDKANIQTWMSLLIWKKFTAFLMSVSPDSQFCLFKSRYDCCAGAIIGKETQVV